LNNNNKLENDVQHLRLANAGLEKASEARFADEFNSLTNRNLSLVKN